MNELRVGVIGTGAIGKTHIERLTKQITGARVTAVSDVNSQAAMAVAKEYDSAFYEKGEDLIAAADVDAVVVCSWDPTHEQYVLASIEAGKYVFCEKPLAETAESCRRIVEAEMKKGKKLVQVGFMRRYDAGYRRMKQTIEDGSIGAPLMAHCAHRNASPGPQYETKVNVTGVAIHEIDVLRWLLNEDFAAARLIQPRISRYVQHGQADPQIIELRTKSGVYINIETFMHCQYGYDIQCVMIAGRENGNNGILKMLALPVSRYSLSIAKFCVLVFYLFMEMAVFFAVFAAAGTAAASTMGVTETMPVLYLVKWCAGLFLTMLPSVGTMWAVTILFEKPLLSAGLNLLLVIPGVLVADTPLWIVYPYCYSGCLVSCSLHDFTAGADTAAFALFPFLPAAVLVFALSLAAAVIKFGRKEIL